VANFLGDYKRDCYQTLRANLASNNAEQDVELENGLVSKEFVNELLNRFSYYICLVYARKEPQGSFPPAFGKWAPIDFEHTGYHRLLE
jgi:hypothetical protein